MKLFHDKGLGRLLLYSSLLACLFPLLNLVLIYPRYQAHLLGGIKEEARKVAHHLSRMAKVEASSLRIELSREGEPFLLQDFGVSKIKVLDQQGEVIYSSDPKDIGTVNRHDYFQRVVAKGQDFTRVVEKEERTSDGETINRDVVETYQPLMLDGAFAGAFELYYDITHHRAELNRIYVTSLFYPIPMIILFVVLVGYILKRLDLRTEQWRRDQQEIKSQHTALLIEQERQQHLLVSVENAKQQWEATMDRVEDMVILADVNLMVRRCNRAVAVFCGRPFPEILNHGLADILPGFAIDPDLTADMSFEYRHEASARSFLASVYRIALGDGTDGFVATLHDQTAMKQMTAELERKNQEILASSQGLQRAMDEISSLIQRVVVQEDFGTYFQNDFPVACYEAKSCDKTDCPCHGKKAMRCWQEAGTYCRGERQGKFAKKYKSCAECDYFKAVTADPLNMIGEQFNNMMRVLESKNKALQSAYSELKQTQSQLLQQEKMASVGQLAAGVAHEINNPVGFIASNLSSLQKYSGRIVEYIALEAELIGEAKNPELDARQAEGKKKYKIDYILSDIGDLIEESLEGCERVKKIVQDLKGFSRVDQATRQTVDIHECLDSTINIVWNELKYKARVEKDYQATTPITCFPQQLNQVFLNLLVNAAHAIEKDGLITIKTGQDGDYLMIAVTDNGCGMPPEIVSRIFEPFFTTKEVGKGTGLGLSIVYDIVTKNHHGDIVVDSQVGQGTTFTVRIPYDQKLREILV